MNFTHITSSSAPAHPIDGALRQFGWRRSTFDDLCELRVALRLMMVPLGTVRPTLVVVDVNAWRDETKVYCELASAIAHYAQEYQSVFEQMVVAGQGGVPPIAYGLTPCNCPSGPDGPRWNPMVVPLEWEPGMNTGHEFGLVVRYFARLLRQRRWQCFDQSQLI